MPREHLHINLFMAGTGHHEASWRHPAADPGFAASAAHYITLAKVAEAAALDSVFLADGLSVAVDVRHGMPRNFEPLTLLSAIAASTSQIGLIGTMSTTFTEPFNLARQFASLDHLSGGRAGWNIVTTAEDRSAQNFGMPAMTAHLERYARAAEFVEVVTKLWDSWGDSAVVADHRSGVYAEPARIRTIDHDGSHFRVRGPLNIGRSPQGHPLLVQAGTSEIGQAFAAAHAEIVFAVHQTLDAGQRYYRQFKAKVAEHRRDPDLVKILPGIVPVIGETEAAAHTRARELDELIVPARAIAALEERLGIDLSTHDLDDPLPPLPPAERFTGQRGRYDVIKKLAERERLTLRQMISRLGGGRGHHTVVGAPEQVADRMQQWYDARAADGFTVLPPLLPEGLDLFVQHVAPVLRRRGLLREGYTGRTLREHYGLPRPPNQFTGC